MRVGVDQVSDLANITEGDQAASVEPGGFERLVHYIRVSEQALGDGVKRVYASELPSLKKLRRAQ